MEQRGWNSCHSVERRTVVQIRAGGEKRYSGVLIQVVYAKPVERVNANAQTQLTNNPQAVAGGVAMA